MLVCLTPNWKLLQLADAGLLALWHGDRTGQEGNAAKDIRMLRNTNDA